MPSWLEAVGQARSRLRPHRPPRWNCRGLGGARRPKRREDRQCGNAERTCDDATGHGHMLRPLRRCGRGSQEAPQPASGPRRAGGQPRRPSSGSTATRSGSSMATSACSRTTGFALKATASAARPSSRGRWRRRRRRRCVSAGCRSPPPTPRGHAAFAAASTIGPSTRPVSRPSRPRAGWRASGRGRAARRAGRAARGSRRRPRRRVRRPRARRRSSSCTPSVGRHPLARRREHVDSEPGERRDALAQALGEVEFAAHRALGDLGDVLEASGGLGEQFDHLVSDEGGVGVEHDERAAHAAGSVGRHDRART